MTKNNSNNNKHTVQHRQFKVERRRVVNKFFCFVQCVRCICAQFYDISIHDVSGTKQRIGNKKRREKKCFFFGKKHIADLKHQMFICESMTKAGKNGTFSNIVSRDMATIPHSIDNKLNAFQIPKPNRNFE